jgi:hypothetical protein
MHSSDSFIDVLVRVESAQLLDWENTTLLHLNHLRDELSWCQLRSNVLLLLVFTYLSRETVTLRTAYEALAIQHESGRVDRNLRAGWRHTDGRGGSGASERVS